VQPEHVLKHVKMWQDIMNAVMEATFRHWYTCATKTKRGATKCWELN